MEVIQQRNLIRYVYRCKELFLKLAEHKDTVVSVIRMLKRLEMSARREVKGGTDKMFLHFKIRENEETTLTIQNIEEALSLPEKNQNHKDMLKLLKEASELTNNELKLFLI